MVVIGLTGGIGVGKDEAAKVFKRLDATIIDADKTGHYLLEKDRKLCARLIEIFGNEIVSRNKIDRKKLGAIVFGNKKKLGLLNEAIHPLMKKEFRKEIAKYKKQGKKVIVLNAAVLFEAGWDKIVDKVILVIASKALRIKRLGKRGIGRQKALAMISSQLNDAVKKKKSDFIISNNSSILQLKNKVVNIYNKIS